MIELAQFLAHSRYVTHMWSALVIMNLVLIGPWYLWKIRDTGANYGKIHAWGKPCLRGNQEGSSAREWQS